MRTALLSAVKRAPSGDLRAELQLASRSVLQWQVDLAHALKCKRVVCMCEAANASILAVQKNVEAQGGEFHTVRSNIQLVGLVRADDELVMLADGLLIDRSLAGQLLDHNGHIERGLATIPAAHWLAETHPHDFERVDRERHWAGLAIMRADQVHKLADMPPDGDAMSMLLRLALQARVACHDWSERGLDAGSWLLATDQAGLIEREEAMINGNVSAAPVTAPFHALSAKVVRALGRTGLSLSPWMVAGLGLATMLAGAGAAGLGFGAVGLSIAACGSFAAMLAGQWTLLRERLGLLPKWGIFERALRPSVDAIASLCLILGYIQASPPFAALALPLFAIVISHILGRGRPLAPAIPFWDDRTLHLAGFAIAAAIGVLGEALALFGLASLAYFMVRSHRATG